MFLAVWGLGFLFIHFVFWGGEGGVGVGALGTLGALYGSLLDFPSCSCFGDGIGSLDQGLFVAIPFIDGSLAHQKHILS